MDRDAWNERYAGADLLWSATPNRFVAEAAADQPVGRALDLATGEGRNALWLAERGWRVTAVDFAARALDRGRARAATQGVEIAWVEADVRTWRAPTATFDLVVIAYLQLPSRLRVAVWDAAVHAVAAGGMLCVVGHHARNLTDGHGGPRDPDVLYDASEILAVLEGFDVVRAGEALREVPADDGSTATAIDCLVVARRPQGS